MTRRIAAPQRGRRFNVDRRDDGLRRAAIIAAVAVAVVAVGYFAYRGVFGGGCGDPQYCASDRKIAAPPGYVIVSEIFERRKDALAQPPGTVVDVTLQLKESTLDGRNLSVYRYVEETRAWEPAAAAVLDPQGRTVKASMQDTPAILAVLRRESAAGHVVGYIDRNARLHPDAASRLTILHTRDFRPTSDGALEGAPTEARPEAGVAWYPVISASAADGTNVFIEAMLANSASRSNHVQQIQRKAGDLKLQGIDIAYLDLPADRRSSFSLFVAELAQSLHSSGKVLTLTLPCPLRAQDRVDEGAYDWAELGKAADVLQMAPCRDQSAYRRDLPLILEHLVRAVQPSKLVLGITPYASEKSIQGIRKLTLAEAMTIALALTVPSPEPITTNSNVNIVGTNIDRTESLTGVTWDPDAACVAFTYKANGGRTVWLENVFSVGFKLEFVSKYTLGGFAVEDASDNVYLGNIWPALVPFITSGQPVLLQPNGADLVPKWKVSRGQLEEGAPGRGIVRWLTPADPGTYTVSLTLSDGSALFENEVSVEVRPRAAGTTPTAN